MQRVRIINEKLLAKEYEQRIQEEKVIEKLRRSEEDIEAGRTRNAQEVFKELEEEYGF